MRAARCGPHGVDVASPQITRLLVINDGDDKYLHAREQFSDAIRAMVTSTSDLQVRLSQAFPFIDEVSIDEFVGDTEMVVRFARILAILAPGVAEEADEAIDEVVVKMNELEAIKAAHLICDFLYDL